MATFDAETIDTMCAVAGVDVPQEEKRILAGMLERHVAAFAIVVGALDLGAVASADRFEPDWT